MSLLSISRVVVAMALAGSGVPSFAHETAGVSPSEPTRAAPPVPQLNWTDCGDGFQCTDALLPLDYDHPHGRQIPVALIRHPALDQAHRVGSIFFNPGGPGGSGVEFIRTAPPPAFALFAQFDIIGFDPRGLNTIADCGDNPSYAIPIPRPTTVDDRDFLGAARDYARACRTLDGEVMRHVSTANVARDLDLLRAAVGDSKLNYFGFSYGSVIGATYATMFPGRARSMVLDSPIDVQKYYDDPIQQWREHAGGHEEVLGRFLAACAASEETCGFGEGKPHAALERLLASLDRQPIPSSDPAESRLLSGDDVRAIFEEGLRSRFVWPLIAAGLHEAQAGDGTTLLSLLGASGRSAGDDFQTAVLAVDQRYRRAPLREYFELADRSYAEFPHFWFLSGYWDLVRALWLVDDYDTFRGRVRNPANAAPILLVAITHDPATPYFQAQALLHDLGNARLVTLDGDGHGASTTFDPCVLQAVAGYVNQGVLPPEGTTCAQQGEPFPAAAKSLQRTPIWNLNEPLRTATH